MSPRSASRSSHSMSPSPHRSRSRSPLRRRSRSPAGNGRRDSYDRSERRHRSRSPVSRRRHLGTRDDPEPCKCLGVFGLSVETTERELKKIFKEYGGIDRVQVVMDAKTNRSRGFAFVYFETLEAAKSAKNYCKDLKIDGRPIRVDYSITQRAHTPTPGIYMGCPTGRTERRFGRSGGGYRGDRYRSNRPRSPRRDYGRGFSSDYGYDRGSQRSYGSDRYDRHERYDRSDRKYDRDYERGAPSTYDRSHSRSPDRRPRY